MTYGMTQEKLERAPEASARCAATSQHILIVEGDPIRLDQQKQLLGDAGYQTDTEASLQGALKFTQQCKPDLIVCNTQLPDGDGFALCKQLRANPATRTVSVVLVSPDLEDGSDGQRATEAGANLLLTGSDALDAMPDRIRTLHDPRTQKQPARIAPPSPPSDSDPITELPGVEYFQHRVEEAIQSSSTGNHSVGLIVASLTTYRCIINTFGTNGAHRVLQAAAERMKAAGRDVVCSRIAPARFGILVPRLGDPRQLSRIVHALHEELDKPFQLDGVSVPITSCFGSAECPADALTANELLRRAGTALKYAHDSRSRYSEYKPREQAATPAKPLLVSDLKDAIAQGQLAVWYQPKLNLARGRVDAVEGLLRWIHPERGLISPELFIPIAERAGLMRMMTGWVIKTALSQQRSWLDQGLDLNMAINISPCDLQEPTFPERVIRAIEHHGVPPGNVTLEITETAAVQNLARAAKALGTIRKYGTRIALDDFGTGHASLSHLHQMPFDEIKLDRSFVADLSSRTGQTIARVTTTMAQELGLESVAEGVEDANANNVLKGMGFTRVQGYHLSPALPAADLESWYADRTTALAA